MSPTPTLAEIWQQVRGYPLRAFLIGLAGLTLMNVDHSLFAFVLTEFSEEFGWSLVERGWYIAITFIVAGAMITQFGVLADKIGRRLVIFWSTLLTPLLVAALFVAPTTWLLLIARSLGFGVGAVQSPVTGTLVLEESPPRLRGLMSGTLQIGYPLGFFAASLAVPAVYESFGWRYIFLLPLVFLPFAWIVWKYLREPPAFQAAKAAQKGSAPPSTAMLFRPEYRRKTAMLFTGQFLQVVAYGATFMLTAYFREARGWEAREAIEMVGLSYGVGAFGYILAAWVGEFVLNRRTTIVVWCWLGSMAFAAMIWWAQGWWATAVTFGLMTFFFYGATAVIFTFLAENFPAEMRATAVSFAGSLAVNLGVALGPLLMGYAIVLADWNVAFTICGVIPVFLAGIAFLGVPPVKPAA